MMVLHNFEKDSRFNKRFNPRTKSAKVKEFDKVKKVLSLFSYCKAKLIRVFMLLSTTTTLCNMFE